MITKNLLIKTNRRIELDRCTQCEHIDTCTVCKNPNDNSHVYLCDNCIQTHNFIK